ncbi:ATP-binding cassette domain-containing protein [Schleiferilactobacillus shenzhenensis]|uniref:ABC transporter domain-containing protein n=1 Tax=Schleiferilactobacillus shenzhenensis LY-73 TaxID=1231336 RepID=U4TJJ2_9LACO|nr:ATP-binding cassette domain-containing protein [Schleiferilactobacillus shenzhenensis]ERL64369.1 hypothetical protein L248_1031 [Schleiferilactobacillus shenzhenensis LY-73]
MEISISHITVALEQKTIINDFTGRFQTGQLIGIKGPSGAGKTTLLNTIGLLQTPTSGSITIDGEPVLNLHERRKRYFYRNIFGFVFQDFKLLDDASIKKNLAIGTRFTKPHQALTIRQALTAVGLPGVDQKMKVAKLSGGEKQRLALARIMVKPTQIILADEPTGSLDSVNSDAVFNILDQIAHHDNKTVIVVTHANAYDNAFDQLYHLPAEG